MSHPKDRVVIILLGKIQRKRFFVNHNVVLWEREKENRLSRREDDLDVPGA